MTPVTRATVVFVPAPPHFRYLCMSCGLPRHTKRTPAFGHPERAGNLYICQPCVDKLPLGATDPQAPDVPF